MHNSTGLLNDLSTTELVQLKDAVDAQIERLDAKVKEYTTDPELYPQARVVAGWREGKKDLAWKVSAIIEARLEEAKGEQAVRTLESILAPYIPTVEEN